MNARESLEPLLRSNSHDSAGEDDRPRHTRRASLDSIDERMEIRVRSLELATEGRDRIGGGILLAGVTLFFGGALTLILSSSPTKLGYFAPHAPMNALGITCFALGIASVQPPTPPAGIRAARLALHQRVLLGIALPAMATGTSFMYYNKYVHGAEHFTTWHSYCGLFTLSWMLLQAALGAASVWFGGRALGGGMKAKAAYKYHRASGYGLITFALFTAILGGGYSTWAVGRGLNLLRGVAFGLGPALILLGLGMRIRWNKMKLL